MLAGETILQVGEEPGDQRDAQRQTPAHAQGLWPLTPKTGNWAAAKHELIWFSAWLSWTSSHLHAGKESWDLVNVSLGGRVSVWDNQVGKSSKINET